MNNRLILWLMVLFCALAGRAAAQTSTLSVVEQHGSRAQRINLVFLSEGYTAVEMDDYAADVAAAVGFLFSKDPWRRYRSYCNIYRIAVASAQSGCDNGATGGPGVMRNTSFGAGFTNPNVPQWLGLTTDGTAKVFTLLNANVPEYDIAIVLVNDAKYGGAGGNLTVVTTHELGSAVVEHELGHSFALLADEYDVDYPGFAPAESHNTTAQTNRNLVRWRHWIDDTTPVATPETEEYDAVVGLFEGSMYRASGWYRPHNNSVMKTLNRPCGSVNREQFVLRYYNRVSPIDDWAPATGTRTVTQVEDLEFTVTPKVVDDGEALRTHWKIDGVEQLDAVGNRFMTPSEKLGNGNHTVTAVVSDPTGFVRLDPDGVLQDSVSWSLTVSNQPPDNLQDWRNAYGGDLENPAGDGLPNLVKYGLGLPPARPARVAEYPAGSLTRGAAGRYLTLTVSRRLRRQDVDYIVEVSGDLVNWHSGPGSTVLMQDDEQILIIRDATPETGADRRFIRLRVLGY